MTYGNYVFVFLLGSRGSHSWLSLIKSLAVGRFRVRFKDDVY